MFCFCKKNFIKKQLAARNIKFTEFLKETGPDGKSLYGKDGKLLDPTKKPEPDKTLYCDEWFFNYAL